MYVAGILGGPFVRICLVLGVVDPLVRLTALIGVVPVAPPAVLMPLAVHEALELVIVTSL